MFVKREYPLDSSLVCDSDLKNKLDAIVLAPSSSSSSPRYSVI